MSQTQRDMLVRLRNSIALPIGLGLLLFVVGAMLIDGFASERNVRSILWLASFVGLASVGQTLVIIMGGIDLSIPFLVGVANIVAAEAFGAGIADPLVVVGVVGLTAAIGALNGFLSRRFRVHPLIITLGVGSAAVAATLWWTAGFPSGSTPGWVTGVVSVAAKTGPIPLPPIIIIWAVVTVAVVFMERTTSFGRRIFALGANPRAAELALVRPLRMWVAAFAISGAFAGITGILFLGFTGKASGTVGDALLFQTIAAVVIGGTALTGGVGGYARTVIGAIVLILIGNLLLAQGVQSTLIQAATGVLIIVLVSIYGREARLRDTI